MPYGEYYRPPYAFRVLYELTPSNYLRVVIMGPEGGAGGALEVRALLAHALFRE